MQLVEKHVIDRNDPCFMVIDQAAFASKNLYNAALYLIRQSYIFEGKYLTYNQIGKLMKSHEAYKALLAKVSQQVLKQLAHDWENFFKANVLQALINVLLTDESYTSKASFLDRDPITYSQAK